MERHASLDPAQVDDVLMGCANQAGEDNRNVARMALLLAGLPHTVPGETINRLCASGMAAAVHAARAVHMGDAHLMIAGGVEHMTRGPWVMSKASTAFGRDSQMHDTSFGWRFINPKLDAVYGTEGMGTTAENLVDLYGISREDQDRFAAWSQQKAQAAKDAGLLSKEIAPVHRRRVYQSRHNRRGLVQTQACLPKRRRLCDGRKQQRAQRWRMRLDAGERNGDFKKWV